MRLLDYERLPQATSIVELAFLPAPAAVAALSREAGSQFDGELTGKFVEMVRSAR